jgi:hypothetical protein
MDERHIVEAIGKLTGVVTALEMQMQAVLLAATKAGMDTDDVRRAIHATPDPVIPSLGRDAYDQARPALSGGLSRQPCSGRMICLRPASLYSRGLWRHWTRVETVRQQLETGTKTIKARMIQARHRHREVRTALEHE